MYVLFAEYADAIFETFIPHVVSIELSRIYNIYSVALWDI